MSHMRYTRQHECEASITCQSNVHLHLGLQSEWRNGSRCAEPIDHVSGFSRSNRKAERTDGWITVGRMQKQIGRLSLIQSAYYSEGAALHQQTGSHLLLLPLLHLLLLRWNSGRRCISHLWMLRWIMNKRALALCCITISHSFANFQRQETKAER